MPFTACVFVGLMAWNANTLAEPGSIGISLSVTADGSFIPTLTEIKVEAVKPNSAAEAAGLQAGDLFTSIDGCKIPGCAGSRAKTLMDKEAGQTLRLTFTREGQAAREVTITLRMKSSS